MRWVIGKQVVGINSMFYVKWSSNSISEEISWTDNNLLTVQDTSLSDIKCQEFVFIKCGVQIIRHRTYLIKLWNCLLSRDSPNCTEITYNTHWYLKYMLHKAIEWLHKLHALLKRPPWNKRVLTINIIQYQLQTCCGGSFLAHLQNLHCLPLHWPFYCKLGNTKCLLLWKSHFTCVILKNRTGIHVKQGFKKKVPFYWTTGT